MSLSVYITGLLTGLSLIVAIGAQNAFVLRQGLMGAHVFAVALACSLSDAAGSAPAIKLAPTAGALSAVAQRLHQKREGRRLMTAARVIEMVARERRTPGFEHARQAFGFNVRQHVVLG